MDHAILRSRSLMSSPFVGAKREVLAIHRRLLMHLCMRLHAKRVHTASRIWQRVLCREEPLSCWIAKGVASVHPEPGSVNHPYGIGRGMYRKTELTQYSGMGTRRSASGRESSAISHLCNSARDRASLREIGHQVVA